jgi:hypothetical protein
MLQHARMLGDGRRRAKSKNQRASKNINIVDVFTCNILTGAQRLSSTCASVALKGSVASKCGLGLKKELGFKKEKNRKTQVGEKKRLVGSSTPE